MSTRFATKDSLPAILSLGCVDHATLAADVAVCFRRPRIADRLGPDILARPEGYLP